MSWFDDELAKYPMPDAQRRDAIRVLFQKILGRDPSVDDVYLWYKGPDNLAQIAQKFKESPEYFIYSNTPPGMVWDADQGKYVPKDAPASTSGTPPAGTPPAGTPPAGGGTPPSGGGQGARTQQELEQLIGQLGADIPLDANYVNELEKRLKAAGVNVRHPVGPDGQPRLDKLEFPDLGIGADLGRFDGTGLFKGFAPYSLTTGQPLDGGGGGDSGGGSGGTSNGLNAFNAFAQGGGFGSGTFNFPFFGGNPNTAAPYQGPIPQAPFFNTNAIPQNPQFTSPVGQVPNFVNPNGPVPSFTPPPGSTTNPGFTSPVGQVPDFQAPPGSTSIPGFTNPVSTIPDYVLPPDFKAPTAEEARATPGYQFTQDEARQGYERGASARGTLLTGGTLKALSDRAQNVADTYYNNRFGQALQGYQTNVANGQFGYNANLAANAQNFGNAANTYGLNLQGTQANFNNALSGYNANAAANAQNYGQAANAYGLNLAGNAQNFNQGLGAYNANLAGNAQNFGQALSGYDANAAANAQNFNQGLAGYGANVNTNQLNFNNALSGYNTNLNTLGLTFQYPYQVWQGNNSANQQNYANALSAFNTNYATALGIHSTNFSDLYNLSALGMPQQYNPNI